MLDCRLSIAYKRRYRGHLGASPKQFAFDLAHRDFEVLRLTVSRLPLHGCDVHTVDDLFAKLLSASLVVFKLVRTFLLVRDVVLREKRSS
jgi:hypothetical protein